MRFDGKKPIEFSDETVELEQDNLEEETKYKLKLDAPSEPASSVSDDEESLDAFADAEGDEELSFGDDSKGGDEKPFDDEPFDAGVEADEDEDPEKFIQQLAGKLGTSLRKYNDERGEPDFDLEKYAINSVISATHTAEMDEEDQKDIIKKVKMSGAGDENDDIDKDLDMDSEEPKDDEPKGEEPMGDDLGFGDDEEIEEGRSSLEGRSMYNSEVPHNNDDYSELSVAANSELPVEEPNVEDLITKSMKKSEVDELFKKKLDTDTIELQGNEINRLKKKFPGITDKEIADKLLSPKAKSDGIAPDALLTREYDLGEDLDSQYKRVADIRSNMNLDSFYLIFAKHKNGVTLISKSEPTSRVDGFASGDDTLIPLFVDGDYARNVGANWSDYVGRQYNDPVFDEFKEFDLGEGYYEESWADPMELKEGSEVSDDLKYHLDNKISLGESVFRYGSDKYVELCSEVKDLKDRELINLNENDEKLLEDFTNQSIIIEGETILLNLIIEDNGEYILEGDKYKGKKTNSPSRGAGGGKAYKVFVPGCVKETKSNPRGIKKIRFGSGGLKAKLSNSKAKKSYNARHGCSKGKHNDKCKAGYWSCRLPRYANKLGLSGGGTWW